MDELDLRICALIGEGMSQRKAAEACGVSRGKVLRALERHRAGFGDKSGAPPANEQPPPVESPAEEPVPFCRSGERAPRDIRLAAYAAGKAAALAMQFSTPAGFRLPKDAYRAWRAENMSAWRSKPNIVKSRRPVLAREEGRTC